MQIRKRNGKLEPVKFDKITSRIQKQCYGLNDDFIKPMEVAKKVIDGIYDGVTSTEMDNLAAETAAGLTTLHPDYATLAARIAISSLHKTTDKSFSMTMRKLHNYLDPKTGSAPLIADDVYEIIRKHADVLDSVIVYDRDFGYDFFGFKTLERSYLLKMNGKVAERPQHMIMRVSLGIHKNDIDSVIKTYNLMSERWFTHATPTLFNAGTPKPQMSSCFLLVMKDDSIDGIYDTLRQCAAISQSAGGIGLSVSNIRATGSYIKGTGGTSNGLVPMLKVFNSTAKYVDQGGGKRAGAFAIYLEPWHADVFEWLDLKKNHGKEEMRSRDLFYAMWTCDLFMQRVEDGKEWSLFCPSEAPGLQEAYGQEFNELYERYESEGLARRVVSARDLWGAITTSQIETGTPYLLFKDAANIKNNQKHLGTIKSSNLCAEILEYTSADEVAVCNLGSLALPMYVTFVNDVPTFDHNKLYEVAYQATINLDKVIDENYYPIEEARNSNMRHRPIGLGVQGLADTFTKMRMPFESVEARKLNKDIFETIYFAALNASSDRAAEFGTYQTYEGSPASQGILQPDMWGVKPSDRWGWESLREKIAVNGLRNSLLTALMPTASTAQILGNNESFEPFTSNIFVRRTNAGEFVMVNKYLVQDLISFGLWNVDMKNLIIAYNGSVQNIDTIPQNIKDLYKTIFEVSQRSVIDMSADRGPYICQTQSLNLHVEKANNAKISSMLMYAWKKGLKTGVYYLRTKAAADAIKFTVDAKTLEQAAKSVQEELVCSIDNPDACEACSG